eukprot:g15282.t1
MLLASIQASYGVVSSSLLSLALLIFLASVTLQHQQQGGGISPQLDLVHEGAVMFRVHEVGAEEAGAGSRRVKKFVLQENSGSGGGGGGGGDGGGPEPSPWRNLSVKEVVGLWKSGGEFVDTFVASIKEIDFEAVFFESVPVTRSTMDKRYEYVMVDSPRLASVSANGGDFAEYIASGEGTNEVVSFRNLRKDARLVVPCKGEEKPGANYAHLTAFVRTGPEEQVIKFFGAVGEAFEEEVASRSDESPVWLSTSGLGVYWLHARLDSVPKYYTYTPYTTVGV